MPTLTIDNRTVTVPDGTNVLEAAKRLGIVIPHFCYHEALGSVGACRLCAMKFLEGPVKGIQMSCMIPAQDGMVVSTVDEEAKKMRGLVIEWLMINHPHDCPVCDEGGECLLQDYTIAGGHGVRRYRGKKRTFLNQDLGPFIQHEMNRCIECYRCSRFYQEYAGGSDFGPMGSAGRVYFGRFREGPFDSPFSGNLTDICPTGVFTDRTARYKARYWDYQMAPSVCTGCSLGCGIIPAARYRELVKIVPRRNDAVNGMFICDRGRFDKSVNDPARPRTVLLEGVQSGWEEALESVARRISTVREEHGAESVAFVGSPRLSLEGGVMLASLAGMIGAPFALFATEEEAERTAAAVEGVMTGTAVSLAELGKMDLVAVHQSDLLQEGPLAALAIRQAWRKGAKVLLSDSPAEGLPFPTESFSNIATACGSGCADQAIVFSASHNSASSIRTLSLMARKVFPLLPGPNSFGASMLSAIHGGSSLQRLLRGRKLRALAAFEADLPLDLPEEIEVIALSDWRPLPLGRAGAVLPACAPFEMDATWVNNEGRAQRSRRVYEPGLPIRGLDPALHPPRVHRLLPPGGALLPSWRIIAGLHELLGGEKTDQPLSGEWEFLRDLDPEGEGVRVTEIRPAKGGEP